MKLFNITSHNLNKEQVKEAKETLGVQSIVSLPDSLQKKWSNIAPEGDLDVNFLEDLAAWLQKKGGKGDYVLIQGEFGATFYMVTRAIELEYIPVYATTRREVTEKTIEGKTVSERVFKHVQFRRYSKPK